MMSGSSTTAGGLIIRILFALVFLLWSPSALVGGFSTTTNSRSARRPTIPLAERCTTQQQTQQPGGGKGLRCTTQQQRRGLTTQYMFSSFFSSQNIEGTDEIGSEKGAGSSKSRMLGGMGMPSNPGWKSGRLNRLTRWADNRTPNRAIICQYKPDGMWLWLRWRGTVLRSTWVSVVLAMGVGLLLDIFARHTLGTTKWAWYSVPPQTHQLIQVLGGLRKAYEYHLTLTTFILTFFLSQSLGYWQKVYNTVRMIQGRINDYCQIVVMSSQRNAAAPQPKTWPQPKTSASDVNYKNAYTPKSREVVQRCTRLIRMSHIFFWASAPTASNGLNDSERFILDAANCPLPLDEDEGIGPVLLSPFGLKALVNTGQLTKQEAEGLVETGLPPSQYAYILLVWVGLHTMTALREGLLDGGPGLESNLIKQLTALRASMFDVDDFRAGRMPLAYVQLVQVLVDSLVMVTPFALYSELGSLSIPLVGLLTLFFRGLLILSKSLLDPFGVEGFEDQNIRVDVLVSELNFGASRRWIQAGGVLPPTDSEA